MTTCNKTSSQAARLWGLALALAVPIFIFNVLSVIVKWLIRAPAKRILAMNLGVNTQETVAIVTQQGD
ncbi:hypothetical protein ABTN81_19455 [Acinetobacter baumannii]